MGQLAEEPLTGSDTWSAPEVIGTPPDPAGDTPQDGEEQRYVIGRPLRLKVGIPAVAYGSVAGALVGLLDPELRERLFPIIVLPLLTGGVWIAAVVRSKTDGLARRIWTSQLFALSFTVPAAISFCVAAFTGNTIWTGVAVAFSSLAGAAFVREFVVAVEYLRGERRAAPELFDFLVVMACGFALTGFFLIVPLFVANLGERAAYALLPPVAAAFLGGIALLIFADPERTKTAEYLFGAAGLLAFLIGVIESLANLERLGNVNIAWLVRGMWGCAIALFAVAPLWASVPEEGSSAAHRLGWKSPRYNLTYWSLLVLPLLAIVALAGRQSWAPAYVIVSTLVVTGLLAVRQIVTVKENDLLFTELVRRDADRNELLARTIRAAEDERTRIARELHDGPVQDLSALMLRMGRAAERSTTSPEILLTDLRERLSAQIASIRESIAQLRPPLLDKAGLDKALEAEVESSFAHETTKVQTRISPVTGLSSDQELQLFRIAQEAIRNARTHSRAEHVVVRLDQWAGGVELEVRDDGTGFMPQSEQSTRGHIGLASMRERALLAGAKLDLLSTPGAGTIVRATIPPEEIE